MSSRRVGLLLGVLLLVSMLVGSLGACGPATPEQVQVPVTVVVGGTPVVVTPTPLPPPEFVSKDATTFVDLWIADPDTLDPALNYETAGDAIIQNVYDTLVIYNKSSPVDFVPDLASKWEVSPDGQTYTFYVRSGIKFHNGDEMTVDDVAYSFQRGILQGGTNGPQWLLTEPLLGAGIYDIAEMISPTGGLDDDPAGLQASDPALLEQACTGLVNSIVPDPAAGTVTFHLKQPWGPFLPTLAQSWASIIDKNWAIQQGTWDGDCKTWQTYYGKVSEDTPLRAVMNGTGPYMFDHWTPGEEVVLVANDNYWRTADIGPLWPGGPVGPPAIKRVVIKKVAEWGTRFAMFQAGDADFGGVQAASWSQVDPYVGEICDYQSDGSFACAPSATPDQPFIVYKGLPSGTRTDAFFTFQVNAEGGNPYVGSNQLDGNGIPSDFFSDIHIRKAFNYCFDWDALINDAMNGEGIQNVGVSVPGTIGYDQNGPHYTFDIEKCKSELQQAWGGQAWEKGFRFSVVYNTGNQMRQTASQILQANFASIDSKFRIETVGLPWPTLLSEIRNHRVPIFFIGWVEDLHDPHNWAQPFLSRAGTYARRQVLPDEILAQTDALVTAGVMETDVAKRAEIYKQLTKVDYDNAIAIRLATQTGRRYAQRWVEGWYWNPIAPDYYYNFSKK
jgi:peptide/nickel transport system substrate-binding protein